jgi:archaellum component FlaC
MSENEYKELIDFLGKNFERIDERFEKIDERFEKIDGRFEKIDERFEKIDERFEKIDARFEKIDDKFKKIDDQFEEVKRHTGVLIEAVEHKIDIVIEGVMGLNERLDRHMEENEQEHSRLEKMTLVNMADISKLDRRVGGLEEKI